MPGKQRKRGLSSYAKRGDGCAASEDDAENQDKSEVKESFAEESDEDSDSDGDDSDDESDDDDVEQEEDDDDDDQDDESANNNNNKDGKKKTSSSPSLLASKNDKKNRKKEKSALPTSSSSPNRKSKGRFRGKGPFPTGESSSDVENDSSEERTNAHSPSPLREEKKRRNSFLQRLSRSDKLRRRRLSIVRMVWTVL